MNSANIESIIESYIDHYDWNITEEDIRKYFDNNSGIKITDTILPIIVALINARLWQRNAENTTLKLQWQVEWLTHDILWLQNNIEIRNLYQWILEVDKNGKILFVNQLILDNSGYTKEELIGQNMNIFSSGVHPGSFWKNFWQKITSGKEWYGEICNKRKDGTTLWLQTLVIPKMDIHGDLVSFSVFRKDISKLYELTKKLDDEIGKIDHLTGLPNFSKCIIDYTDYREHLLFTILHIRNMSSINAAFWHKVGDEVIQKIARMLKNFSIEFGRTGIHIYKLEGTDFAIVNEWETSRVFLEEQYARVKNIILFDKINNKQIHLSFAIWSSQGESSIISLESLASQALKESRHTNQVEIFTVSDTKNQESIKFFEMRKMVSEAFTHNLFEVYIQEIRKNSPSLLKEWNKKFECLVRMYDWIEKKRLVPPNKFLPVIEKDGKNIELTWVILQKVCEFMQNDKHHYSINLTGDDLRSDGFAQKIISQFTKYRISVDRVSFEILESINIDKYENILINIQALQRAGFGIATDDFGSKDSNYFNMRKFKPNFIKIDMQFVRWIDTDLFSRAVVRSIVSFAHNLEMIVIAEGVETPSEQLVVEALWVDFSQWYLFDKPHPYA